MGNKKKRQERMTRIPASQMTVSEPQFRHRELAVKTDGGVLINTARLETPNETYDADVAWVERKPASVSLYFAKYNYPGTTPPTFLSRVEIRYSFEAFRDNFWKNSREFHQIVRAGPVSANLPARAEPGCDPAQVNAAKSHSMWANFELLSQTGGEASFDVYHMTPRSVVTFIRGQGEIQVVPLVRISLTSIELLALLNACEPIVQALPPSVG